MNGWWTRLRQALCPHAHTVRERRGTVLGLRCDRCDRWTPLGLHQPKKAQRLKARAQASRGRAPVVSIRRRKEG